MVLLGHFGGQHIVVDVTYIVALEGETLVITILAIITISIIVIPKEEIRININNSVYFIASFLPARNWHQNGTPKVHKHGVAQWKP